MTNACISKIFSNCNERILVQLLKKYVEQIDKSINVCVSTRAIIEKYDEQNSNKKTINECTIVLILQLILRYDETNIDF